MKKSATGENRTPDEAFVNQWALYLAARVGSRASIRCATGVFFVSSTIAYTATHTATIMTDHSGTATNHDTSMGSAQTPAEHEAHDPERSLLDDGAHRASLSPTSYLTQPTIQLTHLPTQHTCNTLGHHNKPTSIPRLVCHIASRWCKCKRCFFCCCGSGLFPPPT